MKCWCLSAFICDQFILFIVQNGHFVSSCVLKADSGFSPQPITFFIGEEQITMSYLTSLIRCINLHCKHSFLFLFDWIRQYSFRSSCILFPLTNSNNFITYLLFCLFSFPSPSGLSFFCGIGCSLFISYKV